MICSLLDRIRRHSRAAVVFAAIHLVAVVVVTFLGMLFSFDLSVRSTQGIRESDIVNALFDALTFPLVWAVRGHARWSVVLMPLAVVLNSFLWGWALAEVRVRVRRKR